MYYSRFAMCSRNENVNMTDMTDMTDKSANNTISKDEFSKIFEIVERWDETREIYCEECMYNALRHFDRNMLVDTTCSDDKKHPR